MHEILSNGAQSRFPHIPDSPDLLDEFSTRDCTPLAFALRDSNGTVLVGHVEWILEQPDIACLERLECLLVRLIRY